MWSVSALARISLAAAAATAADDIEAVVYEGGGLPEGRSSMTVKLQVLLDRAGVPPGVIDGYTGGMSESAIRTFVSREVREEDGVLDQKVWVALDGPSASPTLRKYTMTSRDASGLSDPLSEDYSELAELEQLGFTSVQERLAERFHMDQDFLAALNPDLDFAEGNTIAVVASGNPVRGSGRTGGSSQRREPPCGFCRRRNNDRQLPRHCRL